MYQRPPGSFSPFGLPPIIIWVILAAIIVAIFPILTGPLNLNAAIQTVRAAGYTVFASAPGALSGSTTIFICSESHTETLELAGQIDKCTFIADGTNDQVEINLGVDSLPDSGGTVVLSEGTFTLGSSISITAANITLLGQGRGTVITPTTNAVVISVADGGDDVTIRDLAIVGSGDSGDTVQSGVRIKDVDRPRVMHTYIIDVGRDALLLEENVEDAVFAYNYIENPGDDGINPGGAGTDLTVLRTVIHGNTIINAPNGDLVHLSVGSADNIVSDNVIIGPAVRAIAVLGQEGRAIITGNEIRDTTRGIRRAWLTEPEGQLTKVIISNNKFTNITEESVLVEGDGEALISGNWFDVSSATPAQVVRSASSRISFVNNFVNANTGTSYGIIISGDGLKDWIIANNNFTGAGYRPINIFDSGPGVISGNILVVVGRPGVALTGDTSGVLIEGNRITGGIEDNTGDNTFRNNIGYIARGERRTLTGTLSVGVANDQAFTEQNPENVAVIVTRVFVDVTTAGGTLNSLLDVGSATNATTSSDNLIDGVDINTTALYDNIDDQGSSGNSKQRLDANGGTTDWVTGTIIDADADNLEGNYVIEYVALDSG